MFKHLFIVLIYFSKPELCEYDNEVTVVEQEPEIIQDNETEDETIQEDSTEQKDEISINSENSVSNVSTENTINMMMTNLQWEEVSYSLARDYKSCPNIPVILDTQNVNLEGVFSDIYDSQNPQIVANFKEAWVINGYENGAFAPSSEISRTEFLKIVLKTHCLDYDNQNTENLAFVDTNKNSWQARVISRSQDLGIISGDTLEINRGLIDTNLEKQYDLARIEELKRVLRALGLYVGEIDGYYTQDLVEAVYNFQLEQGIVANEYQAWAWSWGPSTRAAFFEKYPETSYRVFRPNDIISKSEALKILMRMSNLQAENPQKLLYSDIDTDWHIPYIRSAQTLGLFDPEADDFEFNPNSWVSRDNMVHLIHNLIGLYR